MGNCEINVRHVRGYPKRNNCHVSNIKIKLNFHTNQGNFLYYDLEENNVGCIKNFENGKRVDGGGCFQLFNMISYH